MHADPQFEPAVGGETGRCLLVARHHRDAPALIHRGAMRTLLAEYRKPDADASLLAALRLALADGLQPDRGDGASQAFRVIAAVEMLAGDVVERHRLGRHQVFEA